MFLTSISRKTIITVESPNTIIRGRGPYLSRLTMNVSTERRTEGIDINPVKTPTFSPRSKGSNSDFEWGLRPEEYTQRKIGNMMNMTASKNHAINIF